MQPLDPEVHYGITDRSFLDRNEVQMELLPDKLRELRWKLNQKAKNEPKFRFYALYDRVFREDVLEAAWKHVGKRKKAAGIDDVKAEDILGEEGGVKAFLATNGMTMDDIKQFRQMDSITPGHPEYGRLTLKEEHDRDLAKGLPVPIPANYFPGDDPTRLPTARWQCHASLFFMNWLNMVYQGTSFDQNDQGPVE